MKLQHFKTITNLMYVVTIKTKNQNHKCVKTKTIQHGFDLLFNTWPCYTLSLFNPNGDFQINPYNHLYKPFLLFSRLFFVALISILSFVLYTYTLLHKHTCQA